MGEVGSESARNLEWDLVQHALRVRFRKSVSAAMRRLPLISNSQGEEFPPVARNALI